MNGIYLRSGEAGDNEADEMVAVEQEDGTQIVKADEIAAAEE